MDIRLLKTLHGATFIFEVPERTVRALELLSDYGDSTVVQHLAQNFSDKFGGSHKQGIIDLLDLGRKARPALSRIDDAMAVINGTKVAVKSKCEGEGEK